MGSLNKFIIACVLMATVTAKSSTKDSIGFPESEENMNIKNKEDRKPVYLPSKCPENELYYPGDQKDDWICDCRPANLYHPPTDGCWPAYEQGPCQVGEYLILPRDSVIPVCEKNPCSVNKYVLWNGTCQKLGSTEPCAFMFPDAAALGVNATTLEIHCVKLNMNMSMRFTAADVRLAADCPPGCKRNVQNICTAV